MAEDYWGNGYWGLGYWGAGYWGQGGTLPPTPPAVSTGGSYGYAERRKKLPYPLLKAIKDYLEVKAS